MHLTRIETAYKRITDPNLLDWCLQLGHDMESVKVKHVRRQIHLENIANSLIWTKKGKIPLCLHWVRALQGIEYKSRISDLHCISSLQLQILPSHTHCRAGVLSIICFPSKILWGLNHLWESSGGQCFCFDEFSQLGQNQFRKWKKKMKNRWFWSNFFPHFSNQNQNQNHQL